MHQAQVDENLEKKKIYETEAPIHIWLSYKHRMIRILFAVGPEEEQKTGNVRLSSHQRRELRLSELRSQLWTPTEITHSYGRPPAGF